MPWKADTHMSYELTMPTSLHDFRIWRPVLAFLKWRHAPGMAV